MRLLLILANFCGFLTIAVTAATAQDLPPLITPGRDTTRIEGPLNARGYVDYLAAVNEETSRGVTAENNAAAAIFQAIGPKDIPESVRNDFFAALGVEPLPDEGNYFVDFFNFVREDSATGDEEPQPFIESRDHWDDFALALNRPWREADCPGIHSWLKWNATHLDNLRGGLSRPRYYLPQISSRGNMGEAAEPAFQVSNGLKSVAQAFVCRANYFIHQGKNDEAIHDLLAVQRLACHVASGPYALEYFFGVGIDDLARRGWLTLLHYGKLSAKEQLALQRQIAALPAFPRLRDKFDRGERYLDLSIFASVADRGPRILSEWGLYSHLQKVPIPDFSKLARQKRQFAAWCRRQVVWRAGVDSLHALEHFGYVVAVDFNVPSRLTNQYFDEFVELLDEPNASLRCRKLWLRYRAFHSQTLGRNPSSWREFVFDLFQPREMAGRRLHRDLSPQYDFKSPLLGFRHIAFRAEARNDIFRDQLNLAFALAAYRADEGAYPERLEQLVPKYAAELPQDPYGEGAYRYRRTDEGFVIYTLGENGRDDGGKHDWWDSEDAAHLDIVESDDYRLIAPGNVAIQ